ncbi:MAG: LysM peptidoglycan-binding domain-containing protein [Clostridiales bacterium]
MFKIVITTLFLAVLVLASPINSIANVTNDIYKIEFNYLENKVFLNNKVFGKNEETIIINDSSYIYSRTIVNIFNGNIKWYKGNKILIRVGSDILYFWSDRNYLIKNGNKITIRNKPVNIKGKIYIPIREFGESIDYNIYWIDKTKSIIFDLKNINEYRVTKGDSLWNISNKYGITVDDIKKYNNLKSDYIKVGQIIKLPQF